MAQYSPQGFKVLPTGVKNLLIINVLLYAATFVLQTTKGINIEDYLALYFIGSDMFRPWQYITYMFMHGSFEHIFFNMFALWMFGYILENYWGTRRFLIFYLVCGIGAGLVHSLTIWIASAPVLTDINQYASNPSPEAFIQIFNEHFHGITFPERPTLLSDITNDWRMDLDNPHYGQDTTALLMRLYNEYTIGIPTVGASGAVYGILLAFGMTFPNERIYLYFMVPIKAKWFVIGYAAIELATGLLGTNDGIAHFAHLGGMLFGLIMILYWRKKTIDDRWNN